MVMFFHQGFLIWNTHPYFSKHVVKQLVIIQVLIQSLSEHQNPKIGDLHYALLLRAAVVS